MNVICSDATLVLTHGELSGGSKLTKQFAIEDVKPLLHIDLRKHALDEAIEITLKWLATTNCTALNIAGPRASDDNEIYADVMNFLRRLFNYAFEPLPCSRDRPSL